QHTNMVEAFEMRGSIVEDGNALIWRYTLSSIDRGRAKHDIGELEVKTDAWGNVVSARVIRNALPPAPSEALKPGFYSMLDPSHLVFPLCCNPQGEIVMGGHSLLPIVDQPKSADDLSGLLADPQNGMPSDLTQKQETEHVAELVGTFMYGGRTLVVFRHSGVD